MVIEADHYVDENLILHLFQSRRSNKLLLIVVHSDGNGDNNYLDRLV